MSVSEAAKLFAMAQGPSLSRRSRAAAGIGCAKLAKIQKPGDRRAAVACSALRTVPGSAPVDAPDSSPGMLFTCPLSVSPALYLSPFYEYNSADTVNYLPCSFQPVGS